MSRKKGSSLLETKIRNRIYIKETIYKKEPITRADIAEELGLTLPTITTGVNEMMEEGILTEVELPEEMLPNTAGRKPVGIGLQPDAAHVIGIEIGPYATRAVRMDLRGHVIAGAESEHGADCGYAEILDVLETLVHQVVQNYRPEKIIGVGIGYPGVVDDEKQQIRRSRYPGWEGRRVAADLQERISYPVILDNNVRMRAIGYEMQIPDKKPDSFAYFYISRGIACPLMTIDTMMSGYTSGAGEIGHSIIYVEKDGKQTECQLEDVAGENAIIENCRKLMESGGSAILKHLWEKSGCLEMKQILEAQSAGDEKTEQIVFRAIDYLGVEIANIVNFSSPTFIVLDGYLLSLARNRDRLIRKVRSLLYGSSEEEVNVYYREFDHFNGAAGAGYEVVRRNFLEKG